MVISGGKGGPGRGDSGGEAGLFRIIGDSWVQEKGAWEAIPAQVGFRKKGDSGRMQWEGAVTAGEETR